jgi:hypothetical protein
MASTIDTSQPVFRSPEASGPVRNNFIAASNDINALQAGTTVAPIATGSLVARTLPDRFGEIVNVRDFGAKGDGTTDDTAAFVSAIARSVALWSANVMNRIFMPTGLYRIVSALPVMLWPVSWLGEGNLRTTIKLDPNFTGDLFAYSDVWNVSNTNTPSFPFNGNTMVLTGLRTGAMFEEFTILGDRTNGSTQNGVVFYDRVDMVYMRDVNFYYVNGYAIKTGILKNTTESRIRESRFDSVRAFNCGSASSPVVDFSCVLDGGTDVNINVMDIYAPHGDGFVIRADALSSAAGPRSWRIRSLRVEGIEGNPSGYVGDLVRIGDSVLTGVVSDIQMDGLSLVNPYAGGAALRLTAPASASQPFGIIARGYITGNGPGVGVQVDAGRSSSFYFPIMSTAGTNVVIGASPPVGGALMFNGDGKEDTWTWTVDASSNRAVYSPLVKIGTPNTSMAVTAQVPDSTAVGGNNRGVGAVDLQTNRSTAGQVASGASAAIGGGGTNLATGQFGTVAGGFNNLMNGQFSASPGGRSAQDFSRFGVFLFSCGGLGAGQGSAQFGVHVLRGSSASASGIRLTSDQAAAGANNSVNLQHTTAFSLFVIITVIDITTPANVYSYSNQGLLSRGANAASTVLLLGAPVTLTPGLGAGFAISVTADTTLGCLNITMTPPAGNTDTYDAVACVFTSEAR